MMDAESYSKRWNLDLVNQIVVALNLGASIIPLIQSAFPTAYTTSEGLIDLRGIDFSHQNLRGPWINTEGTRSRSGVDLHETDLSGSDLKWAILPRANLKKSLLINADLRDSELIMADLSGADLTGADMTRVWLLNTKFHQAKISSNQLDSRRCLGQLDFDYHAFEI
ncbi:hypothetical protein BVY01_00420 [bacterium I07]|nr:hypothetical protein BVY01_00420 [bacterium I07]